MQIKRIKQLIILFLSEFAACLLVTVLCSFGGTRQPVNQILIAIVGQGLVVWKLVYFLSEIKKGKSKTLAWVDRMIGERDRKIWIAFTVIYSILIWTFVLLFTQHAYALFFEILTQARPLLPFVLLNASIPLQLFFLLPFVLNENLIIPKLSLVGIKVGIGVPFLIAFAVLFLLFGIVSVTGIGVDPYRLNIIDLGVPLFESQIWYIVGLIGIFLWLNTGYQIDVDKNFARWMDIGLFIFIVGIAFAAWSSQQIPLNNNFIIGNQPPAYELYPYSDARDYDVNSIRMLIGESSGSIFRRPLYVWFLSVIHSFVGFDYNKLILWQIGVLSFIPGALYLIGKEINGRIMGLAVAVFSILREINTITASNITSASNSMLLLSDVPSLLCVAVIVLVIFRWTKNPQRGTLSFMLVGGAIGVGVLLRSQFLFLVPVPILLSVWFYKGNLKKLLINLILIILGLLIVISPLLIRNYQITGSFGFDEPGYVKINLSRFDPTGEELALDSNTPDDEVSGILLAYIFSHPLQVIGFITDHFFRSLISTFLIFPVRMVQVNQWKDLFYILEPFWKEVYVQPGFVTSIIIFLNIIILSKGIGTVYKRNPGLLFILIGVFSLYNLSNSIGRLSGWRFILPVDWIGYLLYLIGVMGLLQGLFELINNKPVDTIGKTISKGLQTGKKLPQILGLIAVILIGMGIPLNEKMNNYDLAHTSRQETCSDLVDRAVKYQFYPSKAGFMDYCMDENTVVKKGLSLYPVFFEKDEGYQDASSKWDLEAVQDFPRLIFKLIGEERATAYIQLEQADIEEEFLSGGEVILLGEKARNGIEASVVFYGDQMENVLVTTNPVIGN